MNISSFIDQEQNSFKILNSPQMFFLDMTERCNLRCWFCYNNGNIKNDADFNDLFKILDVMMENGCKEVIYLGGEPTVAPYFFDILDYAENLGFTQSFVSNGQKIDNDFAERLKKYENLNIGLSIHSNSEKIQNEITGSNKAFENLKRAMECLEKKSISWYAQISVIKENYKDLISLFDFIRKFGNPKRLDLSRMVESGVEVKNFLSENEYIEVFEQLNSLSEEKYKIRIESFPRCWLEKISKRRNLNYEKLRQIIRPCYAWISQMSIDIHGNVRLCPTGGVVAGNLLEDGFEYVWKSSWIMKEFRQFKFLPEQCKHCKDLLFCGGGCKRTDKSAIFSKDKFIVEVM